jgi:hypothetical protein
VFSLREQDSTGLGGNLPELSHGRDREFSRAGGPNSRKGEAERPRAPGKLSLTLLRSVSGHTPTRGFSALIADGHWPTASELQPLPSNSQRVAFRGENWFEDLKRLAPAGKK